jgi:shikimate 5-dehydrogenase
LSGIFVYEKMPCDDADAVLAATGQGSGVAGGSVTMPLKQSALRLCAVLSPAASCIGCVNTLSVQPCGSGTARLVGDNTDWAGMLACLSRVMRSCSSALPITCAVIVGSGATARSAAFSLLHLPQITSAFVCNRTRAHAAALAAQFNIGSFGLDDEDAPLGMQGRGVVIISTVSAGAREPASCVAPSQPASSCSVSVSLFNILFHHSNSDSTRYLLRPPWPCPPGS